MRSDLCHADVLRPEELERFKADEEFFKCVRYTLEESMNVSIVLAVFRKLKA